MARRLLALAVAAAALVGGGATTAAARTEASWRVSATVSGDYANTTGWTQCPITGDAALVHETVHVAVRLRPAFTAVFSRGSGLVARFRSSGGGSWTLAGSYPPLVYPPAGGDPGCGAQVPVDCAGPVVLRRPTASLDIRMRGRRTIGYFTTFTEIVESARYAQPDPARPFCSESGDEPTSVVPLFGLGSTSLAARAAPSPDTFPLRIPVARLLGRRAFAVTLPPAALEGCPSLFYTPCQESGAIRMRLTFRPARTGTPTRPVSDQAAAAQSPINGPSAPPTGSESGSGTAAMLASTSSRSLGSPRRRSHHIPPG